MLNWNSNQLTHGWQKGITAFYYALGMSADDFQKPQIGIGVPLLDGNTCNVHAYQLAQEIAAGCREAGLLGFPFGTPGVSDNISQGHEGGNASLPSRNLIANSAECVVTAHCYDGLIGLHNCDKNGPGFAMALARTNFPGLIVSGGSILPGCHNGRDITILDVYDSQAKAAVGAMTQEESQEIIRKACPGPGGCGIAASFNTWGLAMEAIGLMLPASSSIPAVDPEKRAECRRVGAAMVNLLGDEWAGGEPAWDAALAMPGVKLHLYGKREPRPGRKMGHLTALAQSAEAAQALALEPLVGLQLDMDQVRQIKDVSDLGVGLPDAGDNCTTADNVPRQGHGDVLLKRSI